MPASCSRLIWIELWYLRAEMFAFFIRPRRLHKFPLHAGTSNTWFCMHVIPTAQKEQIHMLSKCTNLMMLRRRLPEATSAREKPSCFRKAQSQAHSVLYVSISDSVLHHHQFGRANIRRVGCLIKQVRYYCMLDNHQLPCMRDVDIAVSLNEGIGQLAPQCQ